MEDCGPALGTVCGGLLSRRICDRVGALISCCAGLLRGASAAAHLVFGEAFLATDIDSNKPPHFVRTGGPRSRFDFTTGYHLA